MARGTKKTVEPTIPAIKGMGLDMTCRGHKFEVGQSYEVTGKIVACRNGFHSCPLDGETSPGAVFEYYPPGTSRYFEVEASGETDRAGNKIASAKITVGVEIGISELTRRFVDWAVANTKSKKASNSGDYGAASNSGTHGAASNSGYGGAAFSHAYGGKVMCEGDGQALYCAEFGDDGSIKSVACGITGRGKIKAGAWYVCKSGKLVEFAQ